jgi:glycyl-tRNA synthetase beta chain
MKEHQRYFPVRGADGKLRARFVSVTDRGDEHATLIREGNERVLRARLSDAKFFWDSDRKKTLAALSPRLAEIVYLKNLGTMAEKTARLVRLTGVLHGLLAPANEAMRLPGVLGNARRAAELCKNDLLTDMVGEFPELQGVMGAHYAIAEGEPREVADAVREHYLPRATDDALPKTPSGILLSLAEKWDNLAASFALDLRPTGSQDPYALRRQTIGLLKILAEHRLSLSMEAAFRAAVAGLPAPYDASAAAVPALLAFARDRLYQICIDEGTPHDLLRGAMAAGFDDVTDLKDRLRVLQALRKDRIWQGLVTIVERTHNIHKNTALEGEVQERLLTESAERRLWAVYRDNAEAIRALTDRRRYQEAAVAFHRVFAEPVHAFFAQVFVHVDDPQLRTNRMLLMKAVNRLFSEKIADLSEIGRA